jgi:hypothetical protein
MFAHRKGATTSVHEQHDVADQRQRLQELLLTYLRAADAPRWPGADGMTVKDVLRSYPQAAAAGLVPNLPALLASHPELADVLRDFFAA